MSLVEAQKDGRVSTIKINREEALNALNQEVLLELRNSIIKIEDSSVVIFTGTGNKAFIAGADIKSMREMNSLQASAFAELGQGVVKMLEEAPFVSIAAVNGFALGGGLEMALACDLIYCSDNARFGAPETNLGIIPGFGGTVNLIHRVGYHHAMEMILRGHLISAQEAKDLGLVLKVYQSDDLMNEVNEIAKVLSEKGTYSLLSARRLVRGMVSLDRTRALQLEKESFASLFASGEPKEGMQAFIEKRQPNFHGGNS